MCLLLKRDISNVNKCNVGKYRLFGWVTPAIYKKTDVVKRLFLKLTARFNCYLDLIVMKCNQSVHCRLRC
jgi:hypothetical protein